MTCDFYKLRHTTSELIFSQIKIWIKLHGKHLNILMWSVTLINTDDYITIRMIVDN